jgi:hypothetical protein
MKIVVCPNCKIGRKVEDTWFSSICGNCKEYFNKDTALTEDESIGYLNQEKTLDRGYIEQKAKAERNAYEWRDKQIAKRKK